MRLTILITLCLAAPFLLPAATGSPDPVFATVPFGQWLKQPEPSRIHWALHLSDPELSPHQRYLVTLDIHADVHEPGQFVALVQLTDAKDRVWQKHRDFKASVTESFFILPGNYHLAVAVFDAASGEHSVVQRNLHVPNLKNDPLPEMWRDLPAVEFFETDSSHDRWFLPSIESRLNLSAQTKNPVEVDLLVNLTPPERLAGSTRAQNRILGALIPTTKVFTQVRWRNATLHIEFLDLARRRIAYRQDNVETLDWAKAGGALNSANPGIIDVRSLANRRYAADYFLNRISRRIRPPTQTGPASKIIIILSSPVSFEPGVELRPIQPRPGSDARIIYIRYESRPQLVFSDEGRPHRAPVVDDELEPLLKPLAPHLFEVATPGQFRRALATILDLIAKS